MEIGFTRMIEDIEIEEFDEFCDVSGDGCEKEHLGYVSGWSHLVEGSRLGNDNVDGKRRFIVLNTAKDSQDAVKLKDNYSQVHEHSLEWGGGGSYDCLCTSGDASREELWQLYG